LHVLLLEYRLGAIGVLLGLIDIQYQWVEKLSRIAKQAKITAE